MMKKYIVTGGAGFIGSALVRTLLSPGDATVAVIDNLSTGHRRNLDEVVGKIALHQVDIGISLQSRRSLPAPTRSSISRPSPRFPSPSSIRFPPTSPTLTEPSTSFVPAWRARCAKW